MKNEKEIEKAIVDMESRETLNSIYKEDMLKVLNWVLGKEKTFDGLDGEIEW